LGYWFLQRLEKSFSSLAACYVFLASLAALLLIYARLELQAFPPDWSNLIGGLIHGSNPIHSVTAAQLLAGAQSSLFALRDRMHTSWLFLAVFAAVWVGCLLWMQIERHRRQIDFSRREALWIVGFTVLVCAIAVLYGLGTNGILAHRYPRIISLSDVVAAAFILALPLFAWSRLGRLQEEQEEEEFEREGPPPGRRGFLGLNDDATNAGLGESPSRREVKPVAGWVLNKSGDLLPASQVFHPEVPGENGKAAVTRSIESAERSTAVAERPTAVSAPPLTKTAVEPTGIPVFDTARKPAEMDIDDFRRYLAAMNQSWSRIETIRGEIDEWFEVRRQDAVAHLGAHPGMRAKAVEKNLLNSFPNEKLAAADAEWAEIRKAALEINRWFELQFRARAS
jgi:hypothetical protein